MENSKANAGFALQLQPSNLIAIKTSIGYLKSENNGYFCIFRMKFYWR